MKKKIKVIAFGVRELERDIFNKFNKFNYELQLESGNINEKTMKVCKGFDAVITRASDQVNEAVVGTLKNKYGIKYILTRGAGYNHMDIKALRKHGVLSARVPGYSPTAISELIFSAGMALHRRVWQNADAMAKGDYIIKNEYFAKEIKNSTVGIVGVGKIGLTTAKMFKAVGANVIGYDKYKSKEAKSVVKFKKLDSLLAVSDIVVVHMSYTKGENDGFFNSKLFDKMKKGSIFLNAARGELQNDNDLFKALKSNQLHAAATDVLKGEKTFFNKKDGVPSNVHKKLMSLYPRFIVTTHLGSYTDSAVADMVRISYDNLNQLINNGECINSIK